MKTCFVSLIFILVSNLVSAQYTQNDSALIRTTFDRTFDENIIDEYLFSADSQKVVAALLSISHSEDTSWIKKIIGLNFDRYGKYIASALGQIGESKQSADYIIGKLKTSTKHTYHLNSELGKVGSYNDLEYLLSNQNDPFGVPTAIYNFAARNILYDKSENYLLSLIDPVKYDSELILEALFALYRIGPTDQSYEKLIEVIKNESGNYTIDQLIYALGSLRKLKTFPEDELLFLKYISHSDWRIRVEAAKTLIYFPDYSQKLVDEYLLLLNDSNPNVSRTAAQSLKNISLPENLNKNLLSNIKNKITNELAPNTAGELLQTICTLDQSNTYNFIEEFDDEIEKKFINNVLLETYSDPEFNFEYLKNQLPDADALEQLSIIPALLALQSVLIENNEYNKIIISLLKTDEPATFSILADGIDSTTIRRNIALVQQILLEQAITHVNDARFSEAMGFLVNLAEHIGNAFAKSILELLSSSNVYSVMKLASDKLDLPVEKQPSISNKFDELFPYSFKYSSAEIVTRKGNFVIQFTPAFAPISVGNFCYLATNKFYNNVIFHRVVPNFVIQCGDPSGTGWGGPSYEIKSEFSPLPYNEGVVGMASAGKDTEGSQWFVMHGKFPHLNEKYSVWGHVTKGMEVVNTIDEGDKIVSIKLIE